MYDSNQKWWNSADSVSNDEDGDHDTSQCDCLECKLYRLELTFREITREIREFLKEDLD